MIRIGFNPQVNGSQNSKINFKAEKQFIFSWDKEKSKQDRADAINYAFKCSGDTWDPDEKVCYYEIFNGMNKYAIVATGEDCDENKILEHLHYGGGRYKPAVSRVFTIQSKILNGEDYDYAKMK